MSHLRVHNFKCFEDSGEIKLAPLTIVFGRNNSGKSSVLQSLLILKQTLDSPEYGPRLNLRGPLYPAGSYADLVFQHRSKELVSFDLELDVPHGHFGRVELEFSADEPQSPRLTRLTVRAAGGAPLEIHRGRGRGGPYEMSIASQRIGGEIEANFSFPVNQFLPLIGAEPRRVGRPSEKRQDTREAPKALLDECDRVLRGIRAVGAFRRQPERRYEFRGRAPDVVDAAGEHVVDALIDDAIRRGTQRGELIRAVNTWLKKVGHVRLLPLRRISKSARIFELRLRDTDSGRWANFADVGFGIGQALPVFVEGLRTPPDNLFLVQGPEIHLHPDAQLAMADFLVDLARSGRRVVAETHSEALLLRVRHLIVGVGARASSRRRLRPDEVSVVFVTKTPKGASYIRTLQLDEFAQIKNWPAGFMGETAQERMTLLEDMSRRMESTA